MTEYDIYEDDTVFTSGDYVKFENVGDTVSGTITTISKTTFPDGSNAPTYELLTDDGPKTMTAAQVRLKTALFTEKPRVGHRITVTYSGTLPSGPGKSPTKLFDVTVLRPGAEGFPPAQAPAPVAQAEPLAGQDAAAALAAQMTPEMLAAFKNLL